MGSKQRSHYRLCLSAGEENEWEGSIFSKNEKEFSVSSVLQGLEACL